jgi:hypothetical protein
MSRFAATSVGRAAAASCLLCGVLSAVPGNAEPSGSPATAEDTQRLSGLLSKGFVPDDCVAVDLVGTERGAAIICQFNREANGPSLCNRGSSRLSARTTNWWRAWEPTNHPRHTGTGTLRVRRPATSAAAISLGNPRWCGPATRTCCSGGAKLR